MAQWSQFPTQKESWTEKLQQSEFRGYQELAK